MKDRSGELVSGRKEARKRWGDYFDPNFIDNRETQPTYVGDGWRVGSTMFDRMHSIFLKGRVFG